MCVHFPDHATIIIVVIIIIIIIIIYISYYHNAVLGKKAVGKAMKERDPYQCNSIGNKTLIISVINQGLSMFNVRSLKRIGNSSKVQYLHNYLRIWVFNLVGFTIALLIVQIKLTYTFSMAF